MTETVPSCNGRVLKTNNACNTSRRQGRVVVKLENTVRHAMMHLARMQGQYTVVCPSRFSAWKAARD